MKDNKSTENKKRIFLENDGKKSIPARPIAAQDLGELFDYYRERHNITIIKNGDFSGDVVKANKDVIKKTIKPQIKKFTNEDLKYALFLKEAEISKDTSPANIKIEGCYYYEKELYNEIQEYLADYLSGTKLKQDLSEQEMSDVNGICVNKFSINAKRQLDTIIDTTVSKLKTQLADVCLTKEQAIEEIKRIQDTLSHDKAVGYIFTNNRNKTTGHFESIIITKSAIFKPIEWNGIPGLYRLMPMDFEGIDFYSVDLNHFWINHHKVYMPEQQADTYHCGVLGISGVKRLLQNDARELIKGSLAITFYSDEKGTKQQLFIPSPIFLQYSQSSKYINFLSTIIGSADDGVSEESFEEEEKDVLVTHSDDLSEDSSDDSSDDLSDSSYDFEDDVSIRTLEEVLHQSIEYAAKIGDNQMIERNRETLAGLPAFREQWQQGCSLARQKRNELVNEFSGVNIFLNFAAKRMQTIIATRKLQPTNQEGFFSKSKQSYPHLLLQYRLAEGELASEKVLETLSKIAGDLGKDVALEVTTQFIEWVEGSKKKINIEEINEFKAKLQKEEHGLQH